MAVKNATGNLVMKATLTGSRRAGPLRARPRALACAAASAAARASDRATAASSDQASLML